ATNGPSAVVERSSRAKARHARRGDGEEIATDVRADHTRALGNAAGETVNRRRAPDREIAAAARRILGLPARASVLEQLCREACSVAAVERALACQVAPDEPWSEGVHVEERVGRSDGASAGGVTEATRAALEPLYRRLSQTREPALVQGRHAPLLRALSTGEATPVQRVDALPMVVDGR